MRFTPSDFLAFAKSKKKEKWETAAQGKAFQFSVSNTGITVITSSGKTRRVTNADLVQFCAVYGKAKEEERLVYKKIFISSYLVAIAKKYTPLKTDFRFPEEIDDGIWSEGTIRTVQVNAFERNPEARQRCIEAHGTTCSVCSFSFGDVYGDFARDFIHVHHLNPLATQRTEHNVDPVRDLRPVCPNCHAVIHMRNGCLSIEEAKSMIND